MNASRIEKAIEKRETAKEMPEEQELAGRVRDDFVYMVLEDKVVRAGRKEWSALYRPVSPIVLI